jgi:hypothetical protein
LRRARRLFVHFACRIAELVTVALARRRAEADAAVDRTTRHLVLARRDVAGFFFRGNAAFGHGRGITLIHRPRFYRSSA